MCRHASAAGGSGLSTSRPVAPGPTAFLAASRRSCSCSPRSAAWIANAVPTSSKRVDGLKRITFNPGGVASGAANPRAPADAGCSPEGFAAGAEAARAKARTAVSTQLRVSFTPTTSLPIAKRLVPAETQSENGAAIRDNSLLPLPLKLCLRTGQTSPNAPPSFTSSLTGKAKAFQTD